MLPTRIARFAAACACAAWAGVPTLSAQEITTPFLAITDVDVVDVRSGTVLPDRTVVIEGDRIRSVEAGGDVPEGAERLDGAGRTLIPGLWDVHAHLRHPAAPTLLMPQFLAHGVTGVRDMASDCEEPEEGEICASRMREWNEEVERGELPGPRILAVSSFPLNPPWDFAVTEELARGLIGRIAERGVDWIKVYYRLPPDALRWVIDEASRHGMRVGGHLPLRMTALEASNAGLGSLEHARDFLFDCFPGSAAFRAEARSQNPPMDVMKSMVEDHDPERCAETFRAFVENGTWYVPTHVTRRMDAYADDPEFRNDPRQKYIPADAWQAWQEDADRMVALDPSPEGRATMRGFYEEGLRITGRAHEAGVRIALGTDAGDTYVFPGSGAHDELGELVKAGLTPAEALAAATIRAAEFLRLEDDYGTVEPGKRADLVLLGANPLEDIANSRSIEAVILAGRAYARADLDAMLSEVERSIAAWPGGSMRRMAPATSLASTLGLFGLAACHSDPVGPIDAEPVYSSGGVTVSDGVLRGIVVAENPGTLAIRYYVAIGGSRCHGPTVTQLFPAGGAGPALWDEQGLPAADPGGCKMPHLQRTLEPGQSREMTEELPVELILGDSIPPGTYEVRAVVRQTGPVARQIPVVLGEAVLGS